MSVFRLRVHGLSPWIESMDWVHELRMVVWIDSKDKIYGSNLTSNCKYWVYDFQHFLCIYYTSAKISWIQIFQKRCLRDKCICLVLFLQVLHWNQYDEIFYCKQCKVLLVSSTGCPICFGPPTKNVTNHPFIQFLYYD